MLTSIIYLWFAADAIGAEHPEVQGLRGEFPIGRHGRLILLSVELHHEPILCLLDTGACLSAFDVRLRGKLGPPRGSRVLETPAGPKRVDTFDWPDAKLGGQSLQGDGGIACLDLTEMRQATNDEILGIIGFDVLRACRLSIDFDRGRLQFLDSLPAAPDELGVRLPVEFTGDGPPLIVGSVGDGRSEEFLIDTGAHGNSLAPRTFDAVLRSRRMRLGHSFTSVTVGGEMTGQRGWLDRFGLGPFEQRDLRFSRLNISSLGLRYFSRFQVTFDFPGRALYLKKGARYESDEPRATSGMTLNWIDGEVVIQGVRKDGPGAAAGLRPNDVLVRIDGKESREFDHFALRGLLTSAGGRRVPLRIRRDRDEIDVTVVLAED